MPTIPPLWSLPLPLLALACAKPASVVEPERGRGAASVETEQDRAAAAAAAEARTARLTAWAADNLEGERYLAPIAPDDISFGAGPEARVTFVVFLDYQCPYCNKLERALRTLIETYPTDVRVVVKQFPIATHEHAKRAAEAVLAAHAQGRGPLMHALLFEVGGKLDEQVVAAAELPDPDRFWADLEQGAFSARVEQDIELGKRLGVGSTPSYFINGAPQRGAKTFEQLRELYVAELEVAEQVLAAGALRGEIYELLMANAAPERERPKPKPAAAKPGRPDPAVHYAVPVDGRPSRGPDDALVTIVEFADFECPYSERVQATLTELQARYGKDLRVVYRHQPLPMHKSAERAALAAIAADRQGEFWAMHDLLFAASNEQLASEDFYLDAAAQLGLDLARFRKDWRGSAAAKIVAQDQAVAKQFAATGTPGFFINGRYLAGAQPVERFAELIDEELGAARAYAREHAIAPDTLYTTMAAGWATEVEAPPLAERTRKTIDVSDLFGRGKLRKPDITLVVCSDFDCPYCSRGAQLVDQIFADPKYKDKVAFYFMHFPLPMHKTAMGAHQAAIAAGNQGEFWAMHDLLFADRTRRGQAEYEAMAAELGLDLKQFRQDWASADTLDAIAETKQVCADLGVSGTPTFFVNGRPMRGAMVFEAAAEVLDEELAGGFEAQN